MTNEELLEKVRAEIERLIDSKDPNTYLGVLKIEAYKDVLSLIDSMQEECNITGIKSKEATDKLKECIDNQTEEGLEKARKQLEELTKECMYSKDNYTDEDRKVLCDGCEEECEFNKKEKPVNNGIDLGCGVIWKDEEPVSEDLEKASFDNAQKNYKEGFRGTAMQAFNEGADWRMAQMMAKAVKVNISNASIVSLPMNCSLKVGDKVLIIKEN